MRRLIQYSASLFLCLLLTAGSPARAQDFELRTVALEVTTGWGVTSGDFDGDGDIDMAATGKNPGRVVWYETRYNQEPIEHFLYLVGNSGARYITSADIDNDEDLDLIVAGFGENRFIWFENRGVDFPDVFEIHDLLDGQLGAWQAIPVDLDDNNTNDIAFCNYNGNSAGVIITSSSGDHDLLMTVSVPDPIGVFATDYDHDGDMDVLVASSNQTEGGIFMIEQTAPLQFELTELYVESGLRLTSVCAADLDNDNDLDLIATQISDADGVSWWEQTVSGLVRHNLSGFMVLPRNAVAADFDDDGWIDIAATWNGSYTGMGGVDWWRNSGDGSFEFYEIHSGESPYDLHLTDFDLDGDEDLLTPLSAIGEVVLFRNLLGITAAIAGVVTSNDEGTPLTGIEVTIPETGATVLTDTAGFYRLNIAPGYHSVEIEDNCWEALRIDSVFAAEDSTTVLDIALRHPQIYVGQSSLNAQVYNERESWLSLTVENRGDADLVLDAAVVDSDGDEEWLRVVPEHLELYPGEASGLTVIVTPDTSNSSAWDFYGEIELHSNACPDTVIVIPVFIRVLDTERETPAIPTATRLFPVFPNPFNAEARIRYDLAAPGMITLVLYDIQGRQSLSLYTGFAEAGTHELEFNGYSLASGVYFLRMTANAEQFTQKLHLLK